MIIWSILRVVGLRLMGKIWGAWIDPAAAMTVAAIVVVGLGIGAAQLWPRGHGGAAITQAVTQAVAQRDAVQGEHDKQEIADDAAFNTYIEDLARWRREAEAANGAARGVVISADDPWLRAKRAGRR
jgi:hypothetical protein